MKNLFVLAMILSVPAGASAADGRKVFEKHRERIEKAIFCEEDSRGGVSQAGRMTDCQGNPTEDRGIEVYAEEGLCYERTVAQFLKLSRETNGEVVCISPDEMVVMIQDAYFLVKQSRKSLR